MNAQHRLLGLARISFLILAGAAGAASLAAEDLAASDAGVSQDVSALDFYRQGGAMMHVLLACSIGTIAVVSYCFVRISGKGLAPPRLVDQVNAAMASRDVLSAYSLCQAHPSSYARVLAAALLKVNFDRDLANKASMMDAAAEALDEEEHRYMVWVNYLNIFATLAPMIGLLGTVWGMIASFDALSTQSGDAKGLAAGIKVAMITTVAGLVVGIPAMFFYFFFRDKLLGVIGVVQKNASFAIDILSGEIRLQETARLAGPAEVEASQTAAAEA